MSQQPIFLLSLPRSGSTLTQRLLASHEQIATLAEPMLLLPFLYTLIPRGVQAEYGHNVVVAAIHDFVQALPNGEDDYRREIRDFALRLYSSASPESARYFMDKTPRYHIIADQIVRTFPDARIIVLWRNPLAVVASMINTFGRGRWNIYQWKVDLYDGLANLVSTVSDHGERLHILNYEDLIRTPEQELSRLFKYLELDFSPQLLEHFSDLKLDGRMVDPTGTRQYRDVSTEPLEKWKRSLANPLRKAWCRDYLQWIGEQRLNLMGYRLDQLLDELNNIPGRPRGMVKDALRMSYGKLYARFEPCLFKRPRAMKHKPG